MRVSPGQQFFKGVEVGQKSCCDLRVYFPFPCSAGSNSSIILALMRRYLILFLLVLMPLQLSWAAVGSYCEHETGPQASHFGHHPHKHIAGDAADNDVGQSDKPSKGPHTDCSACTPGGLAVPGQAVDSAAGMLAAFLGFPLRERLFSAPTYPPERPKWASLA